MFLMLDHVYLMPFLIHVLFILFVKIMNIWRPS